jgi:hypothetical protein
MLGSFFLLHPSYRTPRDFFLDSSAKDPKSIDEIPKGEDNPSLSGTKSSPHLSKDPSPQNASPGIVIPCPCDTQKPQSSESAKSPKTTPPNNSCHGISSTSEDPIGGDFAQPQPKSLPW